MASVDSQRFTIEDAFRTYFYVVPDYQREYVWKKKHVKQLLEDIDEQINDQSSEYFIGTVLVAPTNTDDHNHFYVIDGQQRLTTIFLILCVLRVYFFDKEMTGQGEMVKRLTADTYTEEKQGDIKTDLRLNPCYENASAVIKKLVETNGTPVDVRKNIRNAKINVSSSVKNILTAYDVIYEFLAKNYNDKDKLKDYWRYLAKKVMFIQISTPNLDSALKVFETINQRGVGLTPTDLLKNLLFMRVSSDDFPQLKEDWKKIITRLENNKERPARFLRYFLMANYEIEDGAVIRENRIYDWISKQENVTLTDYQDKPFEFVAHIQRNVDCYIQFRQGRHIQFSKVDIEDGKDSPALASLQMLTGKAFSLHYILLLAAANLPKSFFDQFVYQIESFLFYHILTKSPANELEPSFSMWAGEVRRIAHIDNQVEQCKELNNFVREKFEPVIHNKRQATEDALNRLTLDTLDRTRYLLTRLTQHIDMAFRGQSVRGSLVTYRELEIEHILPNTPNDDLLAPWKKAHPEDENPEQSYNECKNRLGNLTLLEAPLNKVAGNKPYLEKKPIYAKSTHYLTQSLSEVKNVGQNTSITRINDYLCAPDEWDAKAIDDRQKKLSKLALEVWKITEIKVKPKA